MAGGLDMMLSENEKMRIEAEEAYRFQVRKNLNGAPARPEGTHDSILKPNIRMSDLEERASKVSAEVFISTSYNPSQGDSLGITATNPTSESVVVIVHYELQTDDRPSNNRLGRIAQPKTKGKPSSVAPTKKYLGVTVPAGESRSAKLEHIGPPQTVFAERIEIQIGAEKVFRKIGKSIGTLTSRQRSVNPDIVATLCLAVMAGSCSMGLLADKAAGSWWLLLAGACGLGLMIWRIRS
jgi:hypothetical protein